MDFLSQVGQDKWVCDMLGYMRNGYYVEVGSGDGKYISNTYFLEKELGWSGVCVEADKEKYDELIKNRSAICVNKAAYSFDGYVKFATGSEIWGVQSCLQVPVETDGEVLPCVTLATILSDANVPKVIDYVSIDAEGADYQVLGGFPWRQYDVKLWTIEHNAYLDKGFLRDKIRDIMMLFDYRLYDLETNNPRAAIFEDWYYNPKYITP